ncbi:MAG: hypothetical protein ACI9BO_001725 [Zhongshania sp.]
MSISHQKILVAYSALLLSAGIVSAGESRNTQSGFLDFNIYPYLSDVNNDSVLTLNIAANLANRFSYFSLFNIGNQTADSELSDTTSYYTEQNLRWQITDNSPFDLTVQYNMRSGDDNDRLRFGGRWRLNDSPQLKSIFEQIHLRYALNLHLVQIDDGDSHVWQMEHSFNLKFPYLSDRLYLGGFIDHTFNEYLPANIPANPIVGEAQLGYRIVENLYAVAEYRINEYRRSDENNLALGVEYKMKW